MNAVVLLVMGEPTAKRVSTTSKLPTPDMICFHWDARVKKQLFLQMSR